MTILNTACAHLLAELKARPGVVHSDELRRIKRNIASDLDTSEATMHNAVKQLEYAELISVAYVKGCTTKIDYVYVRTSEVRDCKRSALLASFTSEELLGELLRREDQGEEQ